MVHAQIHTDNNDLELFLRERTFSRLERVQIPDPVYYPEPDYSIMDTHLDTIEDVATLLGRLDVSSEEDRKYLKEICVKATSILEHVDQRIENIKALPEYVEWKSKACDKLEHLASRIEDVAETCALASSDEFADMIKTEVGNIINVPADN
ncbi:MAG: hypothetical protein OXH01_00740 [Bacteroidetes bacterium]|nr:hypothetical protein [Bacteroidota bacterium]